MKLAAEVSADKLRGGFYTPDRLVAACLDRILALRDRAVSLSILEPSIGDGAFLRGLNTHALGQQVNHFIGLEIIPEEAAKARQEADLAPFQSLIHTTSAIAWCAATHECFDAVVGNPPFVRFQFVRDADIAAIAQLGQRMRTAFRGVSNLWIPVLLGALSRLRVGGAMALVVPAELFTGVSAGVARSWILSNFERLRIDLFEPGSFPCVLQEIVLISGTRISHGIPDGVRKIEFVEHLPNGETQQWSHEIPLGGQSWTRYLLAPHQLNALAQLMAQSTFKRFGDVARVEVSIVTGANEFFSVSSEEAERFNLYPWLEPLLPRIRHAPGLVYTDQDQMAAETEGARAWLLNFAADRPDPILEQEAAKYLAVGEAGNIHLRYKTSIRVPWYRVPSVWTGRLLLSKRSHWYPRLVLNEAEALTTDTIYRGRMLPIYVGQEEDLVASFHNSLTLLSAELEGRSFGGGVLELVPSEISRLVVPFPVAASGFLADLDRLARSCAAKQNSPEALIDATDELLTQRIPQLDTSSLDQVRHARSMLMQRRLDRN